MRRGMNACWFVDNSRRVLKKNNNKPMLQGVTLGSDFVSEHEWGIKTLREAFGCKADAAPGIARRVVCNKVKTVFDVDQGRVEVPLISYHQDENYALLLGNAHNYAKIIEEAASKGRSLSQLIDEHALLNELHPPYGSSKEEWEVASAWDERQFGILVPAKKAYLLQELKQHFDNFNIVIMMGGRGGPFSNPGLIFAVADRLPKETLDDWREGDLDRERLLARHAEIGIEEELKETWGDKWDDGCRWFALSPKWSKEVSGAEELTKYDVCYWLNPCGQEDNYFGWVTVEDLRLWILGRGKIPGGGRNPCDQIQALSDNEDACYAWMIDRLIKDGCPKNEAEKYSFQQFIDDFYDGDWESFVEDATISQEHQNLRR